MSEIVRAGSSFVDITPEVGCYLQGYTRGTPSIGIHRSLYAKATVFDDGSTSAALITADLVGLDAWQVAAVRERVERLTGIFAKNVMVNASHTHAGPTVQGLDGSQWGSMWGNPGDAEYWRNLVANLANVVRAAAACLRPVKMGFGKGAAEFNINRRRPSADGAVLAPNPDSVVDHRVKVLTVVDAAANPSRIAIASPVSVLMHFACHPTIMAMENLEISPDFPGVAQAHVEQSLSEGREGKQLASGQTPVAQFMQGCCGDVRPNLTEPDATEFRAGTKQDAEQLGGILGAEVTRVCGQMDVRSWDPPVRVASKRVSLPYDSVPKQETLEDLVRRGGGGGSDTAGWHLAVDGTEFDDAVWAKLTLERMATSPAPKSITAEVQGIRLGDLCIVGIAGETFTEIGLQIEDAAPGPALVIGTTNGNAGYICTEKSYAEGGYEPAFSWMLYTHPAPFKPTNEHLVVEAGRAVVAELFR